MLRAAYAQSRGFRRFGGPVPDLSVTEEIDVADFNGNAVIDITTIGGLTVDNFTHIQVKLQAITRSGTGQQMTIDLRPQGGAFGTTTVRWFETILSVQDIRTTSFQITNAATNTVQEGILWLSSVNQPCPTAIHYSNQNTGDPNPGYHKGMTTTGAVVHDAIRFTAGGALTWVSGTIVITGYRCRVGALYTGSFSASGNVDVTLDTGEYIADVFFSNTTLSVANEALGIRIGTGGSFVATSYAISILDAVGTSTNANSSGLWFSGGSATGKYACGTIYNLQTATVPVCGQFQNLADDGTDTNPQDIRSGMYPTVGTAYDQLRIFPASGTITSGTYYIQTYKPRQTLLGAVDLASYGSPEVVFTGLKKNNASLIVLASADAARASSDSGAFIQVGDSSSYKTDNLQTRVDEAGDAAATATILSVTDDTAKTGAACLAVIAGLPQNTNTQMILAMDMTSGLASGVTATSGSRETRAVENRFKYRNGGGAPNWNAGDLYAVGYSM